MTGVDGGLLLVHAHPDDESICTGATMAHYAARDVPVTLVTCTLGEEGEILTPALSGLEAAQADQLGGYRIGELAAACTALGVTDHRFLGGAGRFRDSGMAGSPSAEHPRAFWRCAEDPARFAEAVAALAEVLREVRPAVVVTYDERGDYGHPDHVMAHRVTMAALEREPVPKVYWIATRTAELDEDASAPPPGPMLAVPAAAQPMGVADEVVTTTVDGDGRAKAAALAAHRTQIDVDGQWFALSNRIGRRIRGQEHFRLAHGPADPRHEHDLFAGLSGASAGRGPDG